MKITGHKTRSIFDRYNIVDDRDIVDVKRKMEKRLEVKQDLMCPRYKKTVARLFTPSDATVGWCGECLFGVKREEVPGVKFASFLEGQKNA